jgi:hypothetical protein
VILIANDDGRKMVEAMELEPFLDEYEYVTGVELTVVAAGERPDFICEKRGKRFGLELVKAMQDPVQRQWDVILGREGLLHGLDAAILVQEAAYRKEKRRGSAGWQHPKSTTPMEPHGTVQLIGVKPKRWRGPHPHRFDGMKPYG